MIDGTRKPLPIGLSWDPSRTERLLGRVHATIDRRRRGRAVLLFTVPVAACALIAVLALRSRDRSDGGTPDRAAVDRAPTRLVMLADGSRVELKNGESRIRLRPGAPSVTRVELQNGGGTFSVTRVPGRTFEVIAGPVTVAVIGTEFDVELRGERTWVQVRRGTVRVSWADGGEVLAVGQSGLFPPPPEAAEPAVSSGPAGGGISAVQAYRASVGRRDYGEAYAVLSRHPALVGDSVEELLTAADVARLSGHGAEAVPYLERVERAHPHDGRAAFAVFTLGRTLLGLGRGGEAARAFARVRSHWPDSPLVEDALVRETEAAARSGDLSRARTLAGEYDAAYPNGRRRSEVRRHAGLE
jgi:transmembrane sensor